MWELLKTVSLLKSEFTKDIIKLRKLINTKKNCRNVNEKILLSNVSKTLKFLIEKLIIIIEQHNPKINE